MTQETTIYLQGMTCQLCANRVEKCLLAQPGVEKARVDFSGRKAVVTYDPEKGVPELFCAAIEKTGYRAALSPPGRQLFSEISFKNR